MFDEKKSAAYHEIQNFTLDIPVFPPKLGSRRFWNKKDGNKTSDFLILLS